MKYSVKVTKKCLADAPKITAFADKLQELNTQQRRAFNAMAGNMEDSYKKDLELWNCDAMYPAPKKTTLDWWEMVSGVAKKGFEIFNAVKDLIPEGGLGGQGIPGMSAIMGGGKKEEEELMELKFFGGDTKETWAERQRIWRNAVAVCRSERSKFEKALQEITMKSTALSTKRVFGNFERIEISKSQVDEYNAAALATVAAEAQMTAAEHGAAQGTHGKLYSAFKTGLAQAQKNQAASLALKKKIIQ